MEAIRSARREWAQVALLLAAGVVLRLMWFAHAQGGLGATAGSAEASRAALAFAQGRGIADAYYQGYGPTAHLMPVSPAIAGAILRLFSPGSAAANMALLAWSLAQVAGAWLLLRALFVTLGMDARVTRAGLALLCLLTPFAVQETVDFRYWEGAAALALAAANLILIARLDRDGGGDGNADPARTPLPLIAMLFAGTSFISPPVGVGVGACWAVVALRRLSLARCIQLALLTATALAMVIGPWALRNERVLGAPVLLRSDLGLELAIANHPDAASSKAPDAVLAERLRQIHPTQASATPPFRVAPGGEVEYSRRLGDQARSWIATNPAAFARLSLRHMGEYYFPRPWQMAFSGWGGMASERAVVVSLVNLLGLAGIALGVARRRRGYWMLALYAASVGLCYACFEPTMRYIYLVYGMLAFPAAETVLAAAQALVRRVRKMSARPVPARS